LELAGRPSARWARNSSRFGGIESETDKNENAHAPRRNEPSERHFARRSRRPLSLFAKLAPQLTTYC
jgi:hypothetical protein